MPNQTDEFSSRYANKLIKIPVNLTLSGSEVHRVGPATENDLDPIFVLTLGKSVYFWNSSL